MLRSGRHSSCHRRQERREPLPVFMKVDNQEGRCLEARNKPLLLLLARTCTDVYWMFSGRVERCPRLNASRKVRLRRRKSRSSTATMVCLCLRTIGSNPPLGVFSLSLFTHSKSQILLRDQHHTCFVIMTKSMVLLLMDYNSTHIRRKIKYEGIVAVRPR
jgi:hypothetical protein